MVTGIPKEIKTDERRVAIIPSDCRKMIDAGLQVNIETGAGELSGFSDSEYSKAGCRILSTPEELFSQSSLILKVKEPQKNEIRLLNEKHTLFCYLHLGGNPRMAEELRNTGVTAYAFETVKEGSFTPLLAPMSQIAGHLAVIMSSNFIMTPYGGRGLMMGKNSLHEPGKMLIIGLGMAGLSAVEIAASMGIEVYASDISEEKLVNIKSRFPKVNTVKSNTENFKNLLPEMDIVIGAVYIYGKKAPVVLTRDFIKMLPRGAVAFDISIDQGGCFETSKPCTHHEPVFIEEEIVHSAITNLPSAVCRSASISLSKHVTPYAIDLAKGITSQGLQSGLNIKNNSFQIEFLENKGI